MIWAWVAALLAATALVGLGFVAFWPEFPPVDDTPIPGWMRDSGELAHARHRRPKGRREEPRTAEVDEFLEVIRDTPKETPQTPQEPVEPWVWSPGRPDAHHRWEHLGEETQALHWPPAPPEWPPRNTIE